MALIFIDIDAMTAFVSALESAISTSKWAAADLQSKCTLAGDWDPDCASFNGGVSTAELEDILRSARRRLYLAQLIASDVPGVFEVSLDESLVPTTTPAEVSRSIIQLINAMGGSDGLSAEEWHALRESGDVPQELLDVLNANRLDPYFASELARRLQPGQIAEFLGSMNAIVHTKIDERRFVFDTPEPSLEDFSNRYDEMISTLGEVLGLASRGTGSLGVPGMEEQWSGWIKKADTPPHEVDLLSIIVSRGQWPDRFLTSMGSAIDTRQNMEGEGAGWWGLNQFIGSEVLDPRMYLTDPSDPNSAEFHQIVNPLSGLFQAAISNPSVLAGWFPGRDRIPVAVPDEYSSIDLRLWEFLHQPGLDELTIVALVTAIAVNTQTAEGAEPTYWQTTLAGDLETLPLAVQEEIRIYRENNPVWKEVLHGLLDALGCVPALGEVFDGINGGWYATEGDWANAGLSMAGMIPIGGQAITTIRGAAKVGKALDAATDATRIVEAVDSATDAAKSVDVVIHMGQQGKHVPGHPNFNPKGTRSILTKNPNDLASYAGKGTPVGNVPRGQPGFKERDGSIHIVPARP